MPQKAPFDAQDAEQSEKRARRSVERLSSSKLQAKQYSAHALGCEDRKPCDGLHTAEEVCSDKPCPMLVQELIVSQ